MHVCKTQLVWDSRPVAVEQAAGGPMMSKVLKCVCGEAGRRIHEEAVPATRVSGKASKIVNHRSEGTANHTKHTRLTETTTH